MENVIGRRDIRSALFFVSVHQFLYFKRVRACTASRALSEACQELH